MSQGKVVVKLMGGLGNQMLQYATGLSIARKFNFQLLLDVSYFDSDSKIGNTHREFELSIFGQDDEKTRSYFSNPIINKIVMKIPGVRKTILPLMGFTYLTDVDDLFALRKDNVKSTVYLDGYWVKHLYFDAIREDVRRIFDLSKQLTGVNAEVVATMKQTNSVAVHVRRTDYMLPTSSHYVLDMEYYSQSIKSISNKVSNPVFYFFGDDHDWIRTNFSIDNITYILVDNNHGKNSYMDMALMTQAKHVIISNSTFSWWGAYLNGNEGIKITPVKWFLPGKNSYFVYDDFIPAEWEKI